MQVILIIIRYIFAFISVILVAVTTLGTIGLFEEGLSGDGISAITLLLIVTLIALRIGFPETMKPIMSTSLRIIGGAALVITCFCLIAITLSSALNIPVTQLALMSFGGLSFLVVSFAENS